MAHLPGRAVETRIQLAVQDDASANARADEDAYHVPGFALQFLFKNPQRCAVAVVLHGHRHAPQLLLQQFLQRHVLPLQVRGDDHAARFGIDRSGSAQAHPAHLFEVQIKFIHRVPHAAGNPLDDLLGAALGFGAHFRVRQAVELVVENAGQDLGASQIDADVMLSFGSGFSHKAG